MDYLSEKVNSYASEALSSVSNMRRKMGRGEQSSRATDSGNIAASTSEPATRGANQRASATMTARAIRSPLAGGTPFGGDFYTGAPPPAIGFRTDLLDTTARQETRTTEPPPPTGIIGIAPSAPNAEPPRQPQKPARAQLGDSSESLYRDADAWARLWFPRVMILCLLRMLLFIRKLYEDFLATKVYNLTGQTGFLLISALTLFLPTIVFTIYRVARYLQLVLPPLRIISQQQRTAAAGMPKRATGGQPASSPGARGANAEDETQRALMTSSPESASGRQQQQQDDDASGLVTARQSPSQPEDSQQQPTDSQLARQKLESINVDKLGDLPDKETVRVFVGASEQFLHGFLFVFWQLKRQVDVLGYLVERACLWRKPAPREKAELERLRTGSDGLEWFQDFYAAFLALLAQVYMLSANWRPSTQPPERGGSNETVPALAGLIGPLNGAVAPSGNGTSSSSSVTSALVNNSVRVISALFGTQGVSDSGSGKDVLLVSELVVSSLVILSLLVCVRRRDDGILTLGLSMLGWGSLFAARIFVIGLAFVHVRTSVTLTLLVLHVLGITAWLYKIALASHNDAPSERADEAEWDEETAAELGASQSQSQAPPRTEALELDDQQARRTGQTAAAPQAAAAAAAAASETSSWSVLEHLVLLTQILTLFAIPSIFYWPIMFNLKRHARPFKYLVLILIENSFLIGALWWVLSSNQGVVTVAPGQVTPAQFYLLGAGGALSVLGFIFISLYVACKPSLTEYFARADELFNEADQSGIYYEFCSRVFKMPDLSKHSFRRLMDQTEARVEERYELVSETTIDV